MKIASVHFSNICDVSNFVNEASKLQSDVIVYDDKYKVNGKSIMGLFSLSLSKSLKIEVEDEKEADAFFKAIENLISK